MFSNIGTTEILLVLLLVLVFFGAKKIPELAQGIGKGIKEFPKIHEGGSRGCQRAEKADHRE